MSNRERRELETVRDTLLVVTELNKITLGYLTAQGEPAAGQDPAVGIVTELKELSAKAKRQAEEMAKAV